MSRTPSSPNCLARLTNKSALVLWAAHLFLITAGAMACDTSWVSPASGDWLTAGNWTGGVPSAGTDACLTVGTPGSTTTATLNQTGSAANLTLGTLNAVTIGDGATLNLSGNSIHNAGLISIVSGGNPTQLSLSGNTVLDGGGVINLNFSDNGPALASIVSSGGTLTNAANSIGGAGHIGNGSAFNIVNSLGATIVGPTDPQFTLYVDAVGDFTNNGELITTGGTIQVASNLTNFSGNTLTGGRYNLGFGGTLQINSLGTTGGEIVHNNAFIALGGTSQIVDANGIDALSNLQDNQAGASMQISSGRNFQFSDGFTNAGQVVVFDNGTANLSGAFHNSGSLSVNGDSAQAQLFLQGNTTLDGGGTVTLCCSGNNGVITGNSGVTFENVDNLILGQGHIGAGAAIDIVNDGGGTILALNGQSITIDTAGSFTNLGQLQVVAGGTLSIAPGNGFTNQGTAQVNAGGTFAITGNVINSGLLQIDGTLSIVSDTTLSGGGTVRLGGGDPAIITPHNVELHNVDNTIQGYGSIVRGDLWNEGIIQANVAGQTLSINSLDNPMLNSGTLAADAGATLHLQSGLSNYTAATGTLEGGSYIATNGTLQIDVLGGVDNASGTGIVHNGATISLDGAASQIVDASGNDALAGFHDNLGDGNFSIVDGRNFTSPDGVDFTNAGVVFVGAGSTFTVGGTGDYTQTDGVTEVNGALTAAALNILGGSFSGTGVFNGAMVVAQDATLQPGDDPGTLTLGGDLDLEGALIEEIAGESASGDFDSVRDSAHVLLGDGSVLDGFFDFDVPSTPGFADSYDILHADGGVTGTFGTVDFTGLTAGDTWHLRYTADDVYLDITGPAETATPEPGTFLSAAMALAAALAGRKIKTRLC